MSAPHLLAFADFGHKTGSGHVSRQIALGAAWLSFGGTSRISTPSEVSSRLKIQASEAGVDIEDNGLSSNAIVIDSYLMNPDERTHIASNYPCLEVDDFRQVAVHRGQILLDQNFGANTDASGRPDGSRAWGLYGPRFALLRPEFGAKALKEGGRVGPPKVGLMLGGSPSSRLLTHLASEIRQEIPEAHIKIADGSITNMLEFYSDLDIAVTAAGSSVVELAALGIPFVVLVLADNQVQVAESLVRDNLTTVASLESVGSIAHELLMAPETRDVRSKRLRSAVDGLGSLRVATFLSSMLLSVRRVKPSDQEILFEWANDPVTRQNSFSTRVIPWEDHVDWLQSKLKSPTDALYIVEDSANPIAHVRFTGIQSSSEISVVVSPRARGKRYSGRVIRAAVNTFRSEVPDTHLEIEARVKLANLASRKAFVAASFHEDKSSTGLLRYVDRCDGDVVYYR